MKINIFIYNKSIIQIILFSNISILIKERCVCVCIYATWLRKSIACKGLKIWMGIVQGKSKCT